MSDKTIQNATVGTVQPGALTAIARKEDFLQHLQDFLDTHKTEKWCVAAIDVEHFRLYNELYGTAQGNTHSLLYRSVIYMNILSGNALCLFTQ